MAPVRTPLEGLQSSIAGFLGAALVDHTDGRTLETVGSGLDLGSGEDDIMRALKQLELGSSIEDVLLTREDQLRLVRPVDETRVLYLAIDRDRGNLGMARHVMATTAKTLTG